MAEPSLRICLDVMWSKRTAMSAAKKGAQTKAEAKTTTKKSKKAKTTTMMKKNKKAKHAHTCGGHPPVCPPRVHDAILQVLSADTDDTGVPVDKLPGLYQALAGAPREGGALLLGLAMRTARDGSAELAVISSSEGDPLAIDLHALGPEPAAALLCSLACGGSHGGVLVATHDACRLGRALRAACAAAGLATPALAPGALADVQLAHEALTGELAAPLDAVVAAAAGRGGASGGRHQRGRGAARGGGRAAHHSQPSSSASPTAEELAQEARSVRELAARLSGALERRHLRSAWLSAGAAVAAEAAAAPPAPPSSVSGGYGGVRADEGNGNENDDDDGGGYCDHELNGWRRVRFDTTRAHALSTGALLESTRPAAAAPARAHAAAAETDTLLPLLRAPWVYPFGRLCRKGGLTELALDVGRAPVAWTKRGRTALAGAESAVVEHGDVDRVERELGGFGADGRASVSGSLHRVSALRNRAGAPVGVTVRVARAVAAAADPIADLILAPALGGVLLLGPPGSGKTTMMRAAAALLAEVKTVVVVDTSNELGGDGDTTHPALGAARRMMVPALDQQAELMVQCVQNHTPHALVIDEVGRRPEVAAAQTCRRRGVGLLASAHGDLRSLVRNSALNGLVGGVQTVTIGDQAVGRNGSKLRAQREGAPVFDAVVELFASSAPHTHCCRVTTDVAAAVDAILARRKYAAQWRVTDAATGSVRVHDVAA